MLREHGIEEHPHLKNGQNGVHPPLRLLTLVSLLNDNRTEHSLRLCRHLLRYFDI